MLEYTDIIRQYIVTAPRDVRGLSVLAYFVFGWFTRFGLVSFVETRSLIYVFVLMCAECVGVPVKARRKSQISLNYRQSLTA